MNLFALPATREAGGRERGSALIVTLVLLLVMTVVAIAGMSGTVLQERMAGNLLDDTQLFEATEAALRRCAERVVNNNTTASGPAEADTRVDFSEGKAVTTVPAEYYAPESLGNDLSAQGASSLQLACLIEFDGPIDAGRVGGSLRRPLTSNGLVAYTVRASGARVPPGGGAAERPSVILEAKVILRQP